MEGQVKGAIWVKRATDPGESERLLREKRVLAAVRHPGVVRALPGRDVKDELSLALVAGGGVAGRRLPAREVAGLGAAVATTVADLHDMGFVHGALCAEHILLDEQGRPVVCSFGRCGPVAAGPAAAGSGAASTGSGAAVAGSGAPSAGRRGDVAALAGTLLALLDESASEGGEVRSLRRVLARAASRPPGARDFARALAGSVKNAQLPRPGAGEVMGVPGDVERRNARGQERPAPQRKGPGHRRALAVGACAVLAAAALAGELITHPGHPSGAADLRAAPATACPPADDGCGPLPMAGNLFTTSAGRWSAGEAGDVVVLGRWSCHRVAQVALLRPGVGQVWVFRSWAAPGGSVAGSLVADVAGATSLRVLAGPGACDRLEVVGPSNRTEVLRLPGGP